MLAKHVSMLIGLGLFPTFFPNPYPESFIYMAFGVVDSCYCAACLVLLTSISQIFWPSLLTWKWTWTFWFLTEPANPPGQNRLLSTWCLCRQFLFLFFALGSNCETVRAEEHFQCSSCSLGSSSEGSVWFWRGAQCVNHHSAASFLQIWSEESMWVMWLEVRGRSLAWD